MLFPYCDTCRLCHDVLPPVLPLERRRLELARDLLKLEFEAPAEVAADAGLLRYQMRPFTPARPAGNGSARRCSGVQSVPDLRCRAGTGAGAGSTRPPM